MNFVISPAPDIGSGKYLRFQERLADSQIEFDQAIRKDEQVVLIQTGTERQFQVQVGPMGGGQPVGQLLMIAKANPNSSAVGAGLALELFKSDTEVIAEAFEEFWPARRQVVSTDAAGHYLFPIREGHAFQYLWEQRLKQAGESLRPLGRQILGGGLRLVMPPTDQEKDFAEVKIESFFSDASKLYVDTVIKWPSPEGSMIDPPALIQAVEDFTNQRVLPFIQEGET